MKVTIEYDEPKRLIADLPDRTYYTIRGYAFTCYKRSHDDGARRGATEYVDAFTLNIETGRMTMLPPQSPRLVTIGELSGGDLFSFMDSDVVRICDGCRSADWKIAARGVFRLRECTYHSQETPVRRIKRLVYERDEE